MQPVHGYDVRRELQSWRIDESVSSRPGSVYAALKTMERDGLVAVAGRSRSGSSPQRTEYVLTGEGEKEFELMLRTAWWKVEDPSEPFITALTMMTQMPRDELIAALGSRTAQLESRVDQLRFFRASIKDGATGADGEVPEHVREIADFLAARHRAELEWTRTFAKRLREGEYAFVGDAPT